ncbi:MAG: hypothetical protein GF416_07225 [Candidatus Altiarchaeales archaeon]|nr:hypothetical protein [Candidatus Altiarchaeales archaeon]MBD3416903.1 hypothetical protein [Candidatus Altiarchaeales archaeon]
MMKTAAIFLVILLSAAAASADEGRASTMVKAYMQSEVVRSVAGDDAADMSLGKAVVGEMGDTNSTPTPPPIPEEDSTEPVRTAIRAENVESVGYRGSEEELEDAFNTKTKGLKEGIRERVVSSSVLARKVVLAVASREAATEREMKAKNMEMGESEMEEEINSLLEGEDEVGMDSAVTEVYTEHPGKPLKVTAQKPAESTAVRERVKAMDPEFKRKLAYIAAYGSEEEKATLRERLESCADEENRMTAARLYKNIKEKSLNHTMIRMMLLKNTETSVIVMTQTG